MSEKSGDPRVEDLGYWGDHTSFAYDELRRVYVTAWIETEAVSFVLHAYVLVPPTWTLGDARRACRARGWKYVSCSRDLLLLARSRG